MFFYGKESKKLENRSFQIMIHLNWEIEIVKSKNWNTAISDFFLTLIGHALRPSIKFKKFVILTSSFRRTSIKKILKSHYESNFHLNVSESRWVTLLSLSFHPSMPSENRSIDREKLEVTPLFHICLIVDWGKLEIVFSSS